MSETIAAAQQISYADLYERWEKGNWRATEIDFSEDARQWAEVFTEAERRAALWNYAMFHHGEDSVADNLSPFIDAAPLEEQKYFLTTQQVDEARHAVFFTRFMHEVVGRGDGGVASGLDATRVELSWGFERTFGMLDDITAQLRRDRSRTMLAKAVTLYHVVIEATLAQPGQHFIQDALSQRDLLPGFQSGMRNVALDEQRHIAFGVRLLYDLAQEDAEVPAAVAEMLREVIPITTALFVPPGWDRSYTELFGFTLEEIFEEGTRSMESKLKAAGMPLDSLPGPTIIPLDLPHPERAERGIKMLQAGFLGVPDGPVARDPEALALLADVLRRSIDTDAVAGPFVVQWAFTDADPIHVVVDNGSTRGELGSADDADLTWRCSLEDWVAVISGRMDPRQALLRGRIRPTGSPRTLWRARKLFA